MPKCGLAGQTVWNKEKPETEADLQALCTGPHQVLTRETSVQGRRAKTPLRSPPPAHCNPKWEGSMKPHPPSQTLVSKAMKAFQSWDRGRSRVLQARKPNSLARRGVGLSHLQPSSGRCKKVWLPRGRGSNTEKTKPQSTDAQGRWDSS